MKKYLCQVCVLALGMSAFVAPASAAAVGTISNFGPDLAGTPCSNPEGIAADPRGNLYTASDRDGDTVGTVCVFDQSGAFRSTLSVPAGPSGLVALVGLLFEGSHTLFACDAGDGNGSGRVLRIDTRSGVVTQLASGFAFPNAIAEDDFGNLYVSDSILGTINRISQNGPANTVWSSDPLLSTSGFPPFGVNGLAFDRSSRSLFAANTGDSRVLRIPVLPNGGAAPAQIFADGAAIDQLQNTTEALHGADGIALDVLGNVYVAANQANEIQVLSRAGRLIARYSGVGSTSLDFPASLVFKGNQLYFTNASLFDGGVNSRMLVLDAAFPGLPLN